MYQIIFFSFFLVFVSEISAQTLSPAFNGCASKNGQNQPIVIGENETMEDENWYYKCTESTLIAQGCVIDGKRYSVGEAFMAYSQNFYGVCETVSGKYLKATILGCLDAQNNQVEPGNPYVLDRYFWANCTLTRKIVQSPTLGDVTLDVIGRQIIGCNDETYDIIKDGDNFVTIKANRPLLAGIGYICRVNRPNPQLQPVVCLIANSTSDLTYVTLGTGCYVNLHDYLYACVIEEHALGNGTSQFSWEIGWNTSTPENLASLKSKSFHDCANEPSQSNGGTATVPPSQRKKRQLVENGESGLFSTERYERLNGWIEAASRFIET